MDKDGSHDDMGKAETSLRALLAAGKEPVKSQRGFSVLETKKSGKVALQPTLLLARGPCATLFTFSILRHPHALVPFCLLTLGCAPSPTSPRVDQTVRQPLRGEGQHLALQHFPRLH